MTSFRFDDPGTLSSLTRCLIRIEGEATPKRKDNKKRVIRGKTGNRRRRRNRDRKGIQNKKVGVGIEETNISDRKRNRRKVEVLRGE